MHTKAIDGERRLFGKSSFVLSLILCFWIKVSTYPVSYDKFRRLKNIFKNRKEKKPVLAQVDDSCETILRSFINTYCPINAEAEAR